MVVDSHSQRRPDRLFQALADATRRDIVGVVLREPRTVSALARRYPMSFAAVQKHVSVLERAGLVSKERRGREQLVRGNIETVRETGRLLDELEAIWRARLDQFEAVLGEIETREGANDAAGDDREGR